MREGAGPAWCGVRWVGEDGRVWADGHLAHQALVNVVRNAIDAVRERGGTTGMDNAGGCVRGRIERREDASGAGADEGSGAEFDAIVIEDDGPGVPDEVLGRMFNPFFTTRAVGTGLGLPIVHRIMDAHGGRVVVRNRGGGDGTGGASGASVELWFPRAGAGREVGPVRVRGVRVGGAVVGRGVDAA